MFPGRKLPGYVILYALLTLAFFVPMLYCFALQVHFFPFTSWSMFSERRAFGEATTYFILRGTTAGGQLVDIPTSSLTAIKHGWMVPLLALDNSSLQQKSVHPENARLLEQLGGKEHLPEAVLLPELLRGWGRIYNSKLPEDSPRRLRSIQLDEYKWEGKDYSHYDTWMRTWKEPL